MNEGVFQNCKKCWSRTAKLRCQGEMRLHLWDTLVTETRVPYVELTSWIIDKHEKIIKLVELGQGPFWKSQLKIISDDEIFNFWKVSKWEILTMGEVMVYSNFTLWAIHFDIFNIGFFSEFIFYNFPSKFFITPIPGRQELPEWLLSKRK